MQHCKHMQQINLELLVDFPVNPSPNMVESNLNFCHIFLHSRFFEKNIITCSPLVTNLADRRSHLW